LVDEIIFLYGWGPEEEGRLSSLLYMAETAAAMELNPLIFFFTDGATLSRKGLSEKLSEEIEDRFKRVLKNPEIRVYACEEACRKRGITSERLEDSIKIIGYATFLDMAVSAKTVISI
jgi:predicted peroxiredoxin